MLHERTTVRWKVPRSELEGLFKQASCSSIRSTPVYVAGHGVCIKLSLSAGKDDSNTRDVGIFVCATGFPSSTKTMTVVPASSRETLLLHSFRWWPRRLTTCNRALSR